MAGQSELPSQQAPDAGIPDPPLPFTGGRIPASADERAFVERRVMALQFVAPALSFAALLLGFSLEWPRLAALGVAGLGLTGVALGQFAIRERRLMFIRGATLTPKTHRYFIYEGVAAVPFGSAFVITGVSAIVAAAVFLLGAGVDAIRDAVLTRPSLALIPVGAALLCNGLGFVIGFRRSAKSVGDRWWLEFLHLPAGLGGAILVALGIGALGVGAFESLLPDMFDRALARLQSGPSSLSR